MGERDKFFNRLREEMARNGVTRKQIAAFLGVNVTTVYRWFRCGTVPGVDKAILIKREFFPSLSVEELFEN